LTGDAPVRQSSPVQGRRTDALPLFAFAAVLSGVGCLGGCATVDLGDNIVAPDLQLDEDYFYCVIEPQVMQVGSCATGAAGEAGSCHTARSSMRLSDTTSVAPPTCEDDRPTTAVPDEFMLDFRAVQFTVQSDPLSSPFYRRPTGLDSHPRVIFTADSVEAGLIEEWISRGAL